MSPTAAVALPLSPTAAALSPTAAPPLSQTAGSTATAQALALSGTAKGLQPLPERPKPIAKMANDPVEDFFAITLLSVPFTALWSLAGALIVGSISQGHFPPVIGTPLLTGAALTAAGASVTIGLVSIQWGSGSSAKAGSPTAQAVPLPTLTPQIPKTKTPQP
jgi:hypothetical protein